MTLNPSCDSSKATRLLACKSCVRDGLRGANRAIIETWGRDVKGADLTIFMGAGLNGTSLFREEVALDCPDDYESLPLKTKAILRWALDRNYEFIFLFDTDTFVVPELLLASGFEKYDLYGLLPGEIGVPAARDGFWTWPSGGAGYWLSARAARAVVSAPMLKSDSEWAEDRMVGQVLGPFLQRGEMKAKHDERYSGTRIGNEWYGSITSHYCAHGLQREFDTKWMREMHRYGAPKVRNSV